MISMITSLSVKLTGSPAEQQEQKSLNLRNSAIFRVRKIFGELQNNLSLNSFTTESFYVQEEN